MTLACTHYVHTALTHTSARTHKRTHARTLLLTILKKLHQQEDQRADTHHIPHTGTLSLKHSDTFIRKFYSYYFLQNVEQAETRHYQEDQRTETSLQADGEHRKLHTRLQGPRYTRYGVLCHGGSIRRKGLQFGMCMCVCVYVCVCVCMCVYVCVCVRACACTLFHHISSLISLLSLHKPNLGT